MKKLFGTNGIRFVVDEGLDPNFLVDSGRAIGTFFGGRKLVLGRDTRASGEFVKAAVSSGLLASGCDIVDLGVVPSPCLQLAAKEMGVPGVMITASHNPPEFNGIKCMDSNGMELSQDDEERIEKLFFGGSFATAGWEELKDIVASDRIPQYLSAIASRVSSKKIADGDLKVVADCGNGAGSLTTPRLLDMLGCRVVSLNAQPSGEPSRPFEPTVENVGALLELIRDRGADLGVAHDGDADRAIFVDEGGEYVHGDRTLALIAKDIVSRTKGLVVTPVSSSMCVEDVVKRAGGSILYTKVGAPLVARMMLEKGAVFGGEENGGLIFPEHLCTRDGGMALAKVLEIMASRKKKLSALLKEIPRYEQFKTRTACPEGLKHPSIRKLEERLKKRGEAINAVDGVKLLRKGGWVLMRPSGTEPVVRIFSEGKTMKDARALAEEGKRLVEDAIKAAG